MKIDFRNAQPEQAEALSNLAIESKGHWGYSTALLDLWRKDLRVEKEFILKHIVEAFYFDDELIGFFAIKLNKDQNELEHLWVLPKFIGKGIGKLAFERIQKTCILHGIEELIIVSDPNAEDFYIKMGANRIGEVPSIPQNRMLPKLKYRMDFHA